MGVAFILKPHAEDHRAVPERSPEDQPLAGQMADDIAEFGAGQGKIVGLGILEPGGQRHERVQLVLPGPGAARCHGPQSRSPRKASTELNTRIEHR